MEQISSEVKLTDTEMNAMTDFISELQKGYTLGRVIALKTLKLLHDFLKKKITEETTLDELIDYLVRIGKHVVKALPLNFPTENIIRRFIFILNSKKDSKELPSSGVLTKEVLCGIYADLSGLESELEELSISISGHVDDCIHKGDAVLVCTKSRSVLDSIADAKAAGKDFEVIATENAPLFTGQDLAAELMKKKIETTVIPDSAIAAFMPRINLVLIGTQAVLANGGLVVPAGTYNAVLLAHHFGIPVCVCTGLYKLSPHYPQNPDAYTAAMEPSMILDYAEDLVDVGGRELVEAVNPRNDYVPPELINLYITNKGCYSPFYIYRLLDEYYGQKDVLA